MSTGGGFEKASIRKAWDLSALASLKKNFGTHVVVIETKVE